MIKAFYEKNNATTLFFHRTPIFLRKTKGKTWSNGRKALPLPSIFAKTTIINYLTYYESVRNRFHFNSRFV